MTRWFAAFYNWFEKKSGSVWSSGLEMLQNAVSRGTWVILMEAWEARVGMWREELCSWGFGKDQRVLGTALEATCVTFW